MRTPMLKVYRDGEYVASCKYYEDAAMLVAINGVVKYGHGKIIWREGQEEIEAGESYDHASDIMRARVRAIHERSYAKAHR